MLKQMWWLQKSRAQLLQLSRVTKRPLKFIGFTTGTLLAISEINKIFNLSQVKTNAIQLKENASLSLQPKYKPSKRTFKSILKRIVRAIQLFLIFLPPIILFPFRFFKFSQNLWYSAFSWSVQKAGIVWIKCFQYLSHRRDIVGEQLASRFIYLRQKSPSHDYKITEQMFKEQFGTTISEMFDSFNPDPIGVGSVGQVYQARYKGQKVAVKVRHPDVQKNVESDIDIIFTASRILSKISSFFEIPITNQSLKKLLINQIDFNIEAQNLVTFNQQFKDSKTVKFPTPILSRESILIEQYVEGIAIEYYQKNDTVFNKQIARNGASIFFQMLMNHNFIHADLHAGNIFVQIKQQDKTWIDKIEDKIKQIHEWFEGKYLQYYEDNEQIKQLYFQSKAEMDEVRQIQRKYNKKIEITLIDVGMVLMLAEIQRQNFTKFVLSVVSKRPELSSEMIYNLSLYKGKPIRDLPLTIEFKRYKQSLYELFVRLSKIKIKDLQGITLLKGMLDAIREHKMSLEGEFATLLTNILIIEQIGRDINPDINILKCTVPYFKNVDLKI